MDTTTLSPEQVEKQNEKQRNPSCSRQTESKLSTLAISLKTKRYWRTWISREMSREHYNLLRFDNSSDFTESYWRLQSFLITEDSTIKDTSFWEQRFWRVLVQEFSAVPDVTHSMDS